MYDALECVVGGFLAYKDKVNYSKIKYVCDSYNYKLSYFNSPRIDTYKKASLLLTSIIDNMDDIESNLEQIPQKKVFLANLKSKRGVIYD